MKKDILFSWDKFISNIEDKKRDEIASKQHKEISSRFEKIMHILGDRIHYIDFDSFTQFEVNDFLMLLHSYVSDEDTLTVREIINANKGNPYYECERVPFAINNLLLSKKKSFFLEDDDFI